MQRFLAVLDEPALLVTASGVVRRTNAPALRLFGRLAGEIEGRALAGLTADPPEKVSALLRLFSGSRTAVIGSLSLHTDDGVVHRCRCRGGRLGGADDPDEPLLLLRFEEAAHDRSKVLTEKVVALNAEIRRSKLAQHQLEAALRQKNMLLRELHHRVKNNLQVLLGILLLGEQQAKAPEALAAIHDARLRVEAMALLQRLFYQKEDLSRVDVIPFLQEICAGVARTFHRPGIAVRVVPVEISLPLDLASALGLIVNELLTNAFKHAFPDEQEGEVTVRLERERSDGDLLTLVVEDNGRGPDGVQRSGTGLLLVRGLAQQHGGACVVEAGSGTRCVVTLRDRQRASSSRPLH
ncbi:sensor histidine kinase [Benzoatithermus flavus]|uniref:histidine kinase n=1 Tax=Benzoatithermus flavus TaxID=3108223 RepID=A0ABU8XUE3_9PROT